MPGAPISVANLFFRVPDVFTGILALSGIYDAKYGFGDSFLLSWNALRVPM